ncbi:MAG: nicotinamide-nucleotide amidohydrolase family protein [bacterium]
MIAEIVTLISEWESLPGGRSGTDRTVQDRVRDLLRRSGIQVLSMRRLLREDLVVERALSNSMTLFDLVLVLDASAEGGEKTLRKVLAQVGGKGLVLTGELFEDLKGYYRNKGIALPRDIETRALLPRDAHWIPPREGVRPGIFMAVEGKSLLVLPDEPGELEQMWDRAFRSWIGRRSIHPLHAQTWTFRFIARLPANVQSSLLRTVTGAKLTFFSEGCLTTAALSLEGRDPHRLEREAAQLRGKVLADLGPEFLCEGEETLHGIVGRLLIDRSLSIAVAESCTGGLITSMLVEVPGISSVLDRGVVTYSNTAKTDLLGVEEDVFKAHGAVSRETARAMSYGIRTRAGTGIGLAVTGIAGPGGGSRDKPVGTVFIGLSTPEGDEVTEYHFQGDRQMVRLQSAQMALDRVRRYLLGS